MSRDKIHILYTMANNARSEYFDRFADMGSKTEGVKLTFVCMYPERPKMIDDMAKWGWECIWIKYDDTKRKRGMIKAFFDFLKIYKKLKPDIVHSILFDDSVPALAAARIAGIKGRLVVKADTGFHHRYAPFWVKFDKFNNSNATHVITISQENDQLVRDIEDPDLEKLRMIHSGLDAEQVTACTPEMEQQVREKYHLIKFRRMVLKVARMIEWKGHHHLVEAIPYVLSRHPDTLFILMGEGEERTRLEKMVDELKINDNIIFGGFVSRPELNGLYHEADVLVHAASLEPFGGAITEGMLNALPLITTPSGISKECIVHKENGFFVQPDAVSVAEGIIWAFDHPEEAKKMGEAGRQTALSEHTKEVNWERTMELYREIMQY